MNNKTRNYHEAAKEAVKHLLKLREQKEEDFNHVVDPLITSLYVPDKKLNKHLDDLKKQTLISNLPKKDRPKNFHTQIGQLVEKIAYLCFKNISGVTSIKSFQSAGPQYDFLVTGDNSDWGIICELLYVDFSCRDFLIEAKATKKPVSDQQFARLCSLLQINLFRSGGLGIFFTLNGATGFPGREDNFRQRSLRDARLRQVMFSVSTKKPIIVIDQNDILQLGKPGSLIKIMINKIRDLEYLTGMYVSPDLNIEKPIEKDLPKHLDSLENDGR